IRILVSHGFMFIVPIDGDRHCKLCTDRPDRMTGINFDHGSLASTAKPVTTPKRLTIRTGMRFHKEREEGLRSLCGSHERPLAFLFTQPFAFHDESAEGQDRGKTETYDAIDRPFEHG